MFGNPGGDLLTHYEAELIIEKLHLIDIKEYGSQDWFKQNEVLQKLNMQSHANTLLKSDEYIMEAFVTFEKVKLLIFDIITCEVWKSQILPFLKKDIAQMNSYRSYLSIYHEATLVNLLQLMFYHRTAVESAENNLIDLIGYCYRKLVGLLNSPVKKRALKQRKAEELLNRTREEEFDEQREDIEFSISMMCISIIRFITDYLKYLPVSVCHNLMVETDILCALVPLIEEKPWMRTNFKEEREVFENNKWNSVQKSEYSNLPKIEGNVWITIYNLFMDPESRNKYELNEFRKNNLLRLRKFLNELLLDQIPVLTTMLRSLEELSIANVRSTTNNNPFIVQQMPEIRESLLKNKNWKEIAEYQRKNFFTQDEESIKADMKKLIDLYGQNIVEGLIDGFHCAQCKKDASKRCTKCKSVWYCSKECQIAHWKEHKPACLKIFEEIKSKEAKATKEKGKLVEEIITSNPGDKKGGALVKELPENENINNAENEKNVNVPLDELD